MTSNEYHMFIYDMPYATRRTLCSIMDSNNKYEELAGVHMKFDVGSVQRLGHAVLRNQSPTDELLREWGTQNHTVLELFILLSRMQHYQAMRVLKNVVDPKYHRLIYEGEENISRLFCTPKEQNTHNGNTNQNTVEENDKFGGQNFNKPENDREIPQKVLFKDNGACANIPKQNDKVDHNRNLRRLLDELNCYPSDSSSLLISYSDLEYATAHWDMRNLLGRGGFGTVYKGVWKNTQVAVKRLEVQKDGNDFEEVWRTHREQSMRELKYLNTCRHDNILPLYGFSIGGLYDCLVYQLMPNGSLEDRLLCRDSLRLPLNWGQRHNIATGTARGLQFLHTFGGKPLVHGDIKSANILLDSNLEPKIGDFGLAREGPLQQYTHVKVSRVHGTRPYLPDEFLRAKKFSPKVDTFSFGIVLFELATGQRAYDDSRAHKLLKDEVESVGDEGAIRLVDMKAGPDYAGIFFRLIGLGKSCVSSKPKDRPEMVLVLQRLVATAPFSERQTSQDGRVACDSAAGPNSFLPAWDLLEPSVHAPAEGSEDDPILPRISALGISGSSHNQSEVN
ncbi:Death domain [Nesidiocoris tenuis]|uniref:non-specific serine/threonine protein kinase n=1 Tax=Nesidiocoris tenuis TaxID=355587 RepID=A0ABN7AF04_9HEMI|nr:Death domain [Nesidiocoris tenuis]